jgi:SAM-dependent methyltransferase/uncharacterized protein YbaR (Trm112 family)
MKKYEYWELLVSPVDHQQLSMGSKDSELVDTAGGENYPIIGGIPVVLPPEYVADWANNILEILFLDDAMKITQQTIEKHGQDDFKDAMQRYIKQTLGKSGVKSAFESYSQLPDSERFRCFLFDWAQSQGWAEDLIDSATLARSKAYKTAEKGKERFESFKSLLDGEPGYFPDYIDAIFDSDPHISVELGCGSGFGSCALISTLNKGQLFFPIDIDYACTANCVGIRKHVSKEDQVFPLVASFWYIPFPDNSIDVICSRFGIDETREVPRVLQEVFRVLKKGGRFVIIAKRDPTKRFRYLIGAMDFSSAELREMAARAGLYAGKEILLEVANRYGFGEIDTKVYKAEDETEQTLHILRKP